MLVCLFFLFGAKAAKYQPSGGRCEHAEGAEQGKTQSLAPCIGIRRRCLAQLCCTSPPIFSACSRTSTRRGVENASPFKGRSAAQGSAPLAARRHRAEKRRARTARPGAPLRSTGLRVMAATPPRVLRSRALENASTAFLITRRARYDPVSGACLLISLSL